MGRSLFIYFNFYFIFENVLSVTFHTLPTYFCTNFVHGTQEICMSRPVLSCSVHAFMTFFLFMA
jgi:hypothetical protein